MGFTPKLSVLYGKSWAPSFTQITDKTDIFRQFADFVPNG